MRNKNHLRDGGMKRIVFYVQCLPRKKAKFIQSSAVDILGDLTNKLCQRTKVRGTAQKIKSTDQRFKRAGRSERQLRGLAVTLGRKRKRGGHKISYQFCVGIAGSDFKFHGGISGIAREWSIGKDACRRQVIAHAQFVMASQTLIIDRRRMRPRRP